MLGKRNRLSCWFHHNNVLGRKDRNCAVTFSKQALACSTAHCTGLFVTDCHRLMKLQETVAFVRETVAFVRQVISVVFYLLNKVIINRV